MQWEDPVELDYGGLYCLSRGFAFCPEGDGEPLKHFEGELTWSDWVLDISCLLNERMAKAWLQLAPMEG
jgi:hypothetical protein